MNDPPTSEISEQYRQLVSALTDKIRHQRWFAGTATSAAKMSFQLSDRLQAAGAVNIPEQA